MVSFNVRVDIDEESDATESTALRNALCEAIVDSCRTVCEAAFDCCEAAFDAGVAVMDGLICFTVLVAQNPTQPPRRSISKT